MGSKKECGGEKQRWTLNVLVFEFDLLWLNTGLGMVTASVVHREDCFSITSYVLATRSIVVISPSPRRPISFSTASSFNFTNFALDP